MTTPLTRTIVSLAAALTVTLALGACLPGQVRPASDGPVSVDAMNGDPLAIRFDNDAREHVHVYLVGVGGQRQWVLGRVEPGARATLRIPEAALAGSQGFVQLAVLTGERLTLQAARDARATFTAAQPASAILAQQWTFGQGRVTALPVRGGRVDVGRQ